MDQISTRKVNCDKPPENYRSALQFLAEHFSVFTLVVWFKGQIFPPGVGGDSN